MNPFTVISKQLVNIQHITGAYIKGKVVYVRLTGGDKVKTTFTCYEEFLVNYTGWVRDMNIDSFPMVKDMLDEMLENEND